MLTIDLLRFNPFSLLDSGAGDSSMSYSIVSTCVASEDVRIVLHRWCEFLFAVATGLEGEYEVIDGLEKVTFGVEAARCTGWGATSLSVGSDDQRREKRLSMIYDLSRVYIGSECNVFWCVTNMWLLLAIVVIAIDQQSKKRRWLDGPGGGETSVFDGM